MMLVNCTTIKIFKIKWMIYMNIQNRVISGSSAYFILFASKIIVIVNGCMKFSTFQHIHMHFHAIFYNTYNTIYFIIHGKKNSISKYNYVDMIVICTHLSYIGMPHCLCMADKKNIYNKFRLLLTYIVRLKILYNFG